MVKSPQRSMTMTTRAAAQVRFAGVSGLVEEGVAIATLVAAQFYGLKLGHV